MAKRSHRNAAEPSGSRRGQRLYVRVIDELRRKVAKGIYPVGTRLPTEAELGEQFKSSRHTIREALRHLRAEGLVSARQGSGTTVERKNSSSSYVHSVGSIAELMRYATATRLSIGKWTKVRADAKLARRLGCSPGRTWFRAEGFRFGKSSTLPLCWTEVFVHTAYSKIRNESGRRLGPIYSWIEDLYGERITEVTQTMRAIHIPPGIVAGLKTVAHAPALEIERIYKGANDRVVEIAFSVHPADRFSYSMSLRRDDV